MLHAAELRLFEEPEIVTGLNEPDPARPVPLRGVPSVRSHYGAKRPPNYLAILLILIFHAVLIYAIAQARQHYVRAKEARLSVVNLSPPPPPPASETPPPPSSPQIIAPPPVVRIPVNEPPRLVTTTEPVRISPVPVAIVAPPSPPAPPAPPAPVSTTIQGGDLSAQMVSGKPPRYPIESRRQHEQGTVVLSLTVGVDGRVESIAVAHSSGSARLDNAARDAVRHWRWQPLVREGHPMRVRGIVEIPFMLTAAA
ncbi:MAG: energy transducer TonB [Sphingobium sp.]